MRVLMTTDTVGGVWTFARELASGLMERGSAVLLVSFGRMPSRSQLDQCADLTRNFGSDFQYVASDVPLEWMEANGYAFEACTRILIAEAAGFNPDIIHSNQFCFGAIDLSVPVIVTAHSDVLSWARACRNSPLADSPWLRRYVERVRNGLDCADGVVAPTRWMLEAVTTSFRLLAMHTVISNGTSIEPFLDSQPSLRAVTAGRIWDEAKGLALLEKVDSPIPLLVVGESQWATGSRVVGGGSCRFLGQLSRNRMIDLFRSSSIYVCPSIYEPFGLAPLEAAQCGCAVLAREIPSLREVWQDAALYFDSADTLSELLHQLSRDSHLLMRARRQSFEHAQSFTSSRMVDQYLNFYEAIQADRMRMKHVA